MSAYDSRVRLLNQIGPKGVGLALREGYRAATGRYILSIDCDVVEILPQFRGIFGPSRKDTTERSAVVSRTNRSS